MRASEHADEIIQSPERRPCRAQVGFDSAPMSYSVSSEMGHDIITQKLSSLDLRTAPEAYEQFSQASTESRPQSGGLHSLEQLNIGNQVSVGSKEEKDSDDPSLYYVQQESLPQAPIYNSELQNVLEDVRENLSSIKADMEQSPLVTDRGSDFFKQYEQVRMLTQLDCPETRTVGFIGNSGVGKSRLINSLLDLEGLARSVS